MTTRAALEHLAPEVLAAQPHVLRTYALLADGERGALVGPRGDISWMCFPGWEDEGIFSTLIGGDGSYTITPDARFVWGGFYEDGTLIWNGRWVTPHAVLECRDALARPADPGRATILRRVRVDRGTVTLRVVLDPRPGFGRDGLRDLHRDEDGVWHARCGTAWLRWCGAARADVEPLAGDPRLGLWLRLEGGEQHDFVLDISDSPLRDAGQAADVLWRETEASWSSGRPDLTSTAAPRDAQHAWAVLTGLTTGEGGTVAAATMALPERADAGRSYDYRYVWCRDQSYIGQSAAAAGITSLLDTSVRYIRERLLSDGDHLMPAYARGGRQVPPERSLGLPGYPGGTDIVGNHIDRQFQLDAFGEALLLFAAADAAGRLDAEGWRAAQVAAEAIETRWQQPDAGIWELSARRWTHSRLICAAGLRRISGRCSGGGAGARWLELADRIVADTTSHALHGSGRWQRTPEDPREDASLLLAALRDAVPADDPRSVATLDAVEHSLTQGHYAYRFRPDERPLGEAEGAFLLCGFWMSLAQRRRGRFLEAMRWFDSTRSACGPSGLLSEEFDVRQRQLRGNLPQAFVHALLLETAQSLGDCG